MTLRIAVLHAHGSLRPNHLATELIHNGRWPADTVDAPDAVIASQIDHADIALLASSWQLTCAGGHEDGARTAIEQTRQRGLRTLVFSDHDATRPLNLSGLGAVVYRTSLLSTVTYVDDAGGFDPHIAINRGGGLASIKFFLSALGGSLEFQEFANSTCSVARVPLQMRHLVALRKYQKTVQTECRCR